MKKIYIDPETWGPESLWDPEQVINYSNEDEEGHPVTRPVMCCLGFACQQLGLPLHVIMRKGLPSHIQTFNDEVTSDFLVFREACEVRASDALVTAAEDLVHRSNYYAVDRQNLLAGVNDWFHGLTEEQKTEKLAATLEVLKQGFTEMGYELVYGKQEAA